MNTKDNILIHAIENNTLINFHELSTEDFTPAIDQYLKKAKLGLEKVCVETQVNWTNVVDRLNSFIDPLDRVWTLLQHLNAVVDNNALRQVYQNNLTRVTQFFTQLTQNSILYQHYKTIKLQLEEHIQADQQNINLHIKQKIIEDTLRNFHLNGANLTSENKKLFVSIQEEKALLSKIFAERVLDATNAFSYITQDINALDGLPQDIITAAKIAAKTSGKKGWKFTLQKQSYQAIIQHASNRSIRKLFYTAYITRASQSGIKHAQGKRIWDTTPIIKRLLQLRDQEAKLLGLQSFTELSLQTKMATSIEQIEEFLNNLSYKIQPLAKANYQKLKKFAKKHLHIKNLKPFDIAYVTEKYRQQIYQLSDETLKQYFPHQAVLNGLFALAHELFNIDIKARTVPVWHQDVCFYDIFRNGQCIAHFYLDLFAREGKHSGAWMDNGCNRYQKLDGTIQKPIAYLITNFTPALKDKPSLLSHDDVITLFHEFGHGLHHMLSQINEREISGINGIEWDAVEFPSQFMENFCWDKTIITSFAKHWQTLEIFPESLFESLIKEKNFSNSFIVLKQIVLSLFDIRIHNHISSENNINIYDIARSIEQKHSIYKELSISHWPNTFEHIFSGSYAAGYYSYKWAEVLSADAFDLFEKEMYLNQKTITNKALGRKFDQEILAVGGSRKAIDSFKAFRGRSPSIDALLHQHGIVNNQQKYKMSTSSSN